MISGMLYQLALELWHVVRGGCLYREVGCVRQSLITNFVNISSLLSVMQQGRIHVASLQIP